MSARQPCISLFQEHLPSADYSLSKDLSMERAWHACCAVRFVCALQSVARFLREHASEVDRVALGEYLGHHDPFAISVMHAFIDTERYNYTTIDLALRRLLRQFWLPGEAQKIDRIMEKVRS